MKGLERHQLLGLIVMVIIIILVIVVIINPGLIFIGWGKGQLDFRDFCIQWSLRNYAEGMGEDVYRPYPPSPGQLSLGKPEDYCAQALGYPPADQTDIDKCKDCCRLKKC
jgi:hypothetical protein